MRAGNKDSDPQTSTNCTALMRGWKDVAQRLLDDTCQKRTGRHEEDGCWPGFEPHKQQDGGFDAIIHTGLTAMTPHNAMTEPFIVATRSLYSAKSFKLKVDTVKLAMVANAFHRHCRERRLAPSRSKARLMN